MNKNYQAGRRFEYERMKAWTSKGYKTLRTAGSHGFADIICVKDNEPPVFIQCKVTQSESAAKKLIADFKKNPPFKSFDTLRMVLEVKMKGSKKIQSVEV